MWGKGMGKGIHAIKICRLFNQDSNIFFVKTLKKIFFKEKVFLWKVCFKVTKQQLLSIKLHVNLNLLDEFLFILSFTHLHIYIYVDSLMLQFIVPVNLNYVLNIYLCP